MHIAMTKKYVLIGLFIFLLPDLTIAGKKNHKRREKADSEQVIIESSGLCLDDDNLITYANKTAYTPAVLKNIKSQEGVIAAIESIPVGTFKALSYTKEAFDKKFKLVKKYNPNQLGFENVSITSLENITEGTVLGIFSGVFSLGQQFKNTDLTKDRSENIKKLVNEGNFDALTEWMFRAKCNIKNSGNGLHHMYYRTKLELNCQKGAYEYPFYPNGTVTPWQLLPPLPSGVAANNLKLVLKKIDDTAKLVIAVVAGKDIRKDSKLRIPTKSVMDEYSIFQGMNHKNSDMDFPEQLVAEEQVSLSTTHEVCRLHNEDVRSGECSGDEIDYETLPALIEIE